MRLSLLQYCHLIDQAGLKSVRSLKLYTETDPHGAPSQSSLRKISDVTSDVGVSFSGDIQDPPGKVLCSPLWVTLLRQGVGLGDPQRSLLTPVVLGFCECLLPGSYACRKSLSISIQLYQTLPYIKVIVALKSCQHIDSVD